MSINCDYHLPYCSCPFFCANISCDTQVDSVGHVLVISPTCLAPTSLPHLCRFLELCLTFSCGSLHLLLPVAGWNLYFEWIFVAGIDLGYDFIYLHVDIQLSQCHLVRSLSFTQHLLLELLLKISWIRTCGTPLGWLGCSIAPLFYSNTMLFPLLILCIILFFVLFVR